MTATHDIHTSGRRIICALLLALLTGVSSMPLAYATDCDLADLIEMSDYGECDKESDKEGSEKDSEKEDTKLASPYSSPSTGLPYYVTLAALMKLDESEPYLRICSPPPEA